MNVVALSYPKLSGFECNRLWLLKNSLARKPQKKDRVRMLYKRLSLLGWTFSIPKIFPDFWNPEFFNSHACSQQLSASLLWQDNNKDVRSVPARLFHPVVQCCPCFHQTPIR